uniref:Reverse transcriptase domain-containing protein n=1 Tax=Tanacetum cinerariifolium TaxID=118510 RepID=A0A6L2L3H7_TANCI|nr:reverse transcriptase domain-containing protein [Tanacetum cinerariifolium]
MHQEKVQQEKLRAVKACLNFEEVSQHSESETPNRRKDLRKRLGYKHICSISRSPELRHDRFESPKKKGPERKTVFKRLEKGGVFHRLGDKEKSMSVYSNDSRRRSYYSSRRDTESYYQSSRSRGAESASKKNKSNRESSRRTEALSEGEDSAEGHSKSRSKRQNSSVEEDDLSQPWAAAKTKRWTMPTQCHMFNSTLTGNARVWFDDLSKESIDSYDDLKKVFLENYLQQKKCIKDLVKIPNIKQRDGESMEEFVRRYKLECRDVKGAPECMKISGFMHEITHPELIKRLHDKIPKSVDEMMKVTTTFLRGEVAAKNSFPSKAVTSNQRAKAKQWEIPGKGGKKEGNLQKRQATGNPDGEEDRTEGHMIIKAEMGGHFVHCMYVDGGSSSKILYEHYFNRLRPKVKSQMEHSTSAWMNFMVVRSPSPYNGEAGKPTDMTGVLRHIAKHRLNICEGCLLVRQKKRGQAPERNKEIYEEVEKLMDAGIMKEVHYHSWMSNPVMVKKHDGSWRICVDFKDLNKAGPKDGYPLPKIDWKVESLCGHPFKCFLDAYKRYHQIKMAKEDEEKTAFITSKGIFCYSKMSFGLKNVGATYQCLVDKAFQKQIGQNLEVYIDELVIKSFTEQEVIRDIKERCLKAVQKLNEKLASLNRFLSKSAEKSLPFFKTLKKCTKKSDFQRIAEAETVFKQMNKGIAELSMLTAPKEKEELIIYLAATKEAIKDKEELLDPSILFMDGSSCIDGSGAGLILTNPEGMKFTYALRFGFEATNNEVKYEALIAGLRIAKQMDEKELLAVVEEEGHMWTTPIHEYLVEEILPEEKKKARVIRRKERRPLQANYVLREIHEGSCSMHAGPSSVVAKALRSGRNSTRRKEKSKGRTPQGKEVYRPVLRNMQQNLTPITSPWPFYKWGIDIAGPFPKGPGKVKFLIVSIDYFTKWIEAKPVATITGAQFRDNPFKDLCENLCIRQCFASIKHPQANGLVERENRSLGKGIKARLDEKSKNWMEEISHVLGAHRTMVKSSNGETQFSLMYGMEAVIPVEIGMPILRTAEVDMIKNDEALGINLDLLKEKIEQAAIQDAKSKAKMERYYNASVRNTSFRPGDFVYRNNKASHAEEGGKLGPKWEGPYKVRKL